MGHGEELAFSLRKMGATGRFCVGKEHAVTYIQGAVVILQERDDDSFNQVRSREIVLHFISLPNA